MKALVVAAVVTACSRPQGNAVLAVHGDAAAPATQHRHYDVFVPAQHAAHPALVIALHGNGGTGPQMRNYTKLDAVAEREGFIVAYPDAIDHHWNDGRPELAHPGQPDDVAFIAALIDELAATYSIDRKRVYVTGISNGGFMSYHLACELPDRIAAIAPVAGNLAVGPACTPSAPISVLAINGTADPLVPYEGGAVARKRGRSLSAAASVAVFAARDNCGVERASVDLPDRDPDDTTRSQRTTYTHCPAGLAVELITVENGGHTWPGQAQTQYLPKFVVGATSRDFDASEAIWAFFAAHPGM